MNMYIKQKMILCIYNQGRHFCRERKSKNMRQYLELCIIRCN